MKPRPKPGNMTQDLETEYILHTAVLLSYLLSIFHTIFKSTVNKDMHDLTSKQELNKDIQDQNKLN